MYPGYLALADVFGGILHFELVNSDRAFAYIEEWNEKVRTGLEGGSCIDWVDACDECPDLALLLTDGIGYNSLVGDPAPWYSPSLPQDSSEFLGVIGLSTDGAEDSTATASTLRSIGSGGVVGKLYFEAREIVVRAIAVASTECGMAYGLRWLRGVYSNPIGICGGDDLLFLECCPVCDLEQVPGIVWCWPDTYAELASGAPCAGNWWPTTYGQLKAGPPENDPYWCAWVDIYRQLKVGPPGFACEVGDCLDPYLRQFKGIRIVGGPTILSRRKTSSGHFYTEFEFTVVTGEPEPFQVNVGIPTSV